MERRCDMDQQIINIASKWNGNGLALLFLITLLFSIFLSAIIGIEREVRGHSAGLRTHVLISSGATILTFISIYAIPVIISAFKDGSFPSDLSIYSSSYDASRIAAGIIAGFGFICAGTILKTGFTIKGLTTSASLWITGAIGLLVGMGLFLEAIIATFITLLVLIAFIYVERLLDLKSSKFVLSSSCDFNLINYVQEMCKINDVVIKKTTTELITNDDKTYQQLSIIFAFSTSKHSLSNLLKLFNANKDVEVESYVLKGESKKA